MHKKVTWKELVSKFGKIHFLLEFASKKRKKLVSKWRFLATKRKKLGTSGKT